MISSDKKNLKKKIKIDLENGMNESEVAIKYGISERRVKIIRRRKPLICQDNDFHKFERIREFGCLDEFKFGKIDPMDLTNIFCEASRSIVTEMMLDAQILRS